MKILAICETNNFQQFTRRATFEAIAQVSNSMDALCYTHIKNIFQVNLKSDFIQVKCCYYFVPLKWIRKHKALRLIQSFVLKIFWGAYFKQYDCVVFSSPPQVLFLPIADQVKAFILSDPYHVLNKEYLYAEEESLLQKADIVFSTSLGLAQEYIKKYFNLKKEKVVYWPNTVDLGVWDVTRYQRMVKKKVVSGYIGNISEITFDIDFFDELTNVCCDIDFELAGNCHFSGDKLELFESIIQKSNVKYHGF